MERNSSNINMKRIVLDGARLSDRETVHEYLQEIFSFPDYYGKNLDALYDCLTEMKDVEIEITMPKEVSPYFYKVMRVFKGAEIAGENITVSVI